MNKDISIWMPLYIGDLQAKFARMTAEQVGATLLLMMDFWKNGAIPHDLATVCSITKLPQQSKAKTLLNMLMALEVFEIESEHIRSTFLTSLKSQALQNQQMKSDKAKNAAQARWNKSASNAQASNKHSNAMLKHPLRTAQALLHLSSSNALHLHLHLHLHLQLQIQIQIQIQILKKKTVIF